MNTSIRRIALAILVTLSTAMLAASSARANSFVVESCTKYDREASSYTVPATVNFVVLKKGASDIVIWTRDELTGDELTVIESYARAHDASL